MNSSLAIQSLKASVSIRSLFEHDGHKLIRLGALHQCLCPFHKERSPSCVIYDDHYFCFGCHSSGDVINYIRNTRNCSFTEAARMLGGTISTVANWRQTKPVRAEKQYLSSAFLEVTMKRWRSQTDLNDLEDEGEKLSVSSEALRRLDVAWADEYQAWAIPMRSANGEMIGIRLRADNGKKWAVTGGRNGMFIPSLPTRMRDLILTEGATDCAAALSMGFHAIGKPMALYSPANIIAFVKARHVQRVIVVPDNDEKATGDNVGISGAKHFIDCCPVPVCEVVLPSKDFREFARAGGSRALFDNMLLHQRWIYPKERP